MPNTSPIAPADAKRVRIDRIGTGRLRLPVGIFAAMTSAVLAGCAQPAKPAEPTVAAAAPVAANTAANTSATMIQCPARGAFGNGPTYYSQFYEDYILGYVFKNQ